MAGHGRDASLVLPDGRTVEHWEGGDPHGRAAIMHPGTPETRVMGRWGHEAAVAAGVRLIALNRPGYGGSTTSTHASLAATGAQTAAVAAAFGLEEYAVFGLSGGGPFALATAAADPDHVRALGVVGGVGPWRVLDGPARDPEGSKCLELLDAGDAAGAWACMRRDAESGYAELAPLDDAARVDDLLARISDGSRLVDDPAYRALWADNLRVVLENLDGYVLDNLAWGARWDVDPRAVTAPTLIWCGERDTPCPPAHARWYAERIAGAEVVTFPGEGHVDVIDGHWPDVLAGLVTIWR